LLLSKSNENILKIWQRPTIPWSIKCEEKYGNVKKAFEIFSNVKRIESAD